MKNVWIDSLPTIKFDGMFPKNLKEILNTHGKETEEFFEATEAFAFLRKDDFIVADGVKFWGKVKVRQFKNCPTSAHVAITDESQTEFIGKFNTQLFSLLLNTP